MNPLPFVEISKTQTPLYKGGFPAMRILLKVYMKLEGFKGQKLSQFFQKNPFKMFFLDIAKNLIHWYVFCLFLP